MRISPQEAARRLAIQEAADLQAAHTTPEARADSLQALTADCSGQLTALADLPDPVPEGENHAALFANGWLRKGGGAFLVAPSGVGKSTWSIQAALLWAQGLPAFGIKPVRPLRIVIVQAEDDAEEMACFRNSIAFGLETESGIARSEVLAAMQSVKLLDIIGAVGNDFVERLRELAALNSDVDLVIVNPFQSYFGGDVAHNAELTAFLRAGIDTVIKPGRIGVLWIHHTNKPPNSKERAGWGTDQFAAYIGAGGAEIVNWARAVLALMPVSEAPGLFKLVAGKRGARLQWRNGAGEPVNSRLIAHHERIIFWRDPTEEEIARCGDKGNKDTNKGAELAKDAEQLADVLRKSGARMSKAREIAEELFPRARARRAFDKIKDNPSAVHLHIARAMKNGALFIGTEPEAEALARAYDNEQGGKAAVNGGLAV